MNILERFRLQRETIREYRSLRDSGKSHDEAADLIIQNAKTRYQPVASSTGGQPRAIDIEKWMKIIEMILALLAMFSK